MVEAAANPPLNRPLEEWSDPRRIIMRMGRMKNAGGIGRYWEGKVDDARRYDSPSMQERGGGPGGEIYIDDTALEPARSLRLEVDKIAQHIRRELDLDGLCGS